MFPSVIEAHLTARGLATEPVDPPHYTADGNWCGPTWAPSAVLIRAACVAPATPTSPTTSATAFARRPLVAADVPDGHR